MQLKNIYGVAVSSAEIAIEVRYALRNKISKGTEYRSFTANRSFDIRFSHYQQKLQ